MYENYLYEQVSRFTAKLSSKTFVYRLFFINYSVCFMFRRSQNQLLFLGMPCNLGFINCKTISGLRSLYEQMMYHRFSRFSAMVYFYRVYLLCINFFFRIFTGIDMFWSNVVIIVHFRDKNRRNSQLLIEPSRTDIQRQSSIDKNILSSIDSKADKARLSFQLI